ncbi:substrate-binding domain-containing protein [Reyranella sp.]|uniref:substrate-binding domain-containing protein n=1 Tax=Reyranella sp. TaxID=1929291 RepID=UPI003D0B45B2
MEWPGDVTNTQHMSISLDTSKYHAGGTLPMLIFRRAVFRRVGLAMLMALASGTSALADDLAGAGSSFVSPILKRWSADYQAKAGQPVKYQSIGSGGGITLVKQETVDFAASDAPLKPQELQKSGLVQFPLVIGGIVPVVNIEGVKPGELKFTVAPGAGARRPGDRHPFADSVAKGHRGRRGHALPHRGRLARSCS